MIITIGEAKEILKLSDSTYDIDIGNFIPIIQDDVCRYCNTYFQDGYIYRESGGQVAMVRGSTEADKITDGNSDFVDAGFIAADDIAIEGGHSNVGIHTIASVIAGTITLTSTGELRNQDPTDSYHSIGTLRISRINWPAGIKIPVAYMIWHMIKHAQSDHDVKSERIDDYAITFIGNNAYPQRISRMLDNYRLARVH